MKVRAMIVAIALAFPSLDPPRANAAYEDEVLKDNPIVYYRFEETEGDQATDSSGNDFHGEYVDGVELGQPSAFPSLGNSALFDGESGYVQMPNLDRETENVTIETWVNLELLAGGCCTSIFSPDGWEPGWLHYNLKGDSNIEFALNSGGPNNHNTEPDTVPFEEWTYIASVYSLDEAEVRTFVNGEEVDVNPPDFQTPLEVAFFVEAQVAAWQNTRFLGGNLDEFAIYDSALSDQRIAEHYQAAMDNTPDVVGDFNGNGVLDQPDVDMLSVEIKAATNTKSFDLNGDDQVNDADLTVWVKGENVAHSWFGDANLDGEFGSGDLVTVFTAGKFELDEDANWMEGDWTADLRFGTSDLVVAFTDGGYELGPRIQGNAVPEPSSLTAIILAASPLALLRRRRSKRALV